MGYECRYHYHEKLDEGGYNKEETLEMIKKVGDVYEDTSLEKLASVIMSQLARRDIWVIDWEVYEFKKAKITCKETKGGLIIKNKKFNFDGTSVVVTEEAATPPPPPVPAGQQPHERLQPQVQTHGDQPHNVGPRRAIKWVRLDDDLPIMLEVQQRGLKFSEGKQYPVFSEVPSLQLGSSIYSMKDDLEREVSVNSKYFLPAKVQLSEERNMSNERDLEPGPRLLYDNVSEAGMPDLDQIKRGGPRAIAAARQVAAAQNPERTTLQRAAAMKKAAMQKGMVHESDMGGQPMNMVNLERGRASKRDDLSGVDMDMAAIVAKSEAKTRQKAPKSPGRKAPRQKTIPINPPDDVDLPMEDEIEDMPDISRLRKRG